MTERAVLDRTETKGKLRTSIILGLLLAIFHGFLASIYLDHPPYYDEMYHMLAAESWRDSGKLRILDGEYHRAALFTKLVGFSANICGPSLECARGISVIATALLVFVVTAFAGTAMHPVVGFLAGLLLTLNPEVIAQSKMVRFYSLHALVFAVSAFILFILATRWRQLGAGKIVALGSIMLAILIFGKHLQPLTQIGLLGAMAGAGILLAPDVRDWLYCQNRWFVLLLIASTLVIVAFGFILIDIEGKIEALRFAAAWTQENVNRHWYYYRMLQGWYPTLWPLMAILALFAIARWPRLSLYCLTIFVVSFVVLSIAAQKTNRYIVFTLPFLFIPMAAGAVMVLQLIIRFIKHRLMQLLGWRAEHPALTPVAVTIILGALAPYIITQPLVLGAARMIIGSYDKYADWPAAAAELRKLVKDYPVVLASSGVKAAYYLGDFSFDLNYSVMRETDTGEEFGLDSRTGRQVISSADSVLKILQNCGPALVIVEDLFYKREYGAPPETVAVLDELGNRFMVTPGIWVWTIQTGHMSAEGDNGKILRPSALQCRPVTPSKAR